MDSPRLQSGKLHETPIRARAIMRRPFAGEIIPDLTTKTYEQKYLVNRQRYTPKTVVPPSVPPTFSGAMLGFGDAADTNAYLVEETDPDEDVIDLLRARVRRLFARVPGTQYAPDSLSFVWPDMHDVTDGTYYSVSWDRGRSAWIFAARKTINTVASLVADTKAVTGTVAGSGTVAGTGAVDGVQNKSLLTAGIQIDLVGGSGTASFLTSDSVATIQAALAAAMGGTAANWQLKIDAYQIIFNVSSSIRSITCSDSRVRIVGDLQPFGVAGQTSITVESADTEATDTRATVDTRAVTDTPNVTETYSVSASKRSFTTSASHGAAVGDRVAFYNGPRVVALSIVLTVPSGTTFEVPLEDVAGKDFGATTCVFSSAALWRVACQPRDCSARVARRFYLPTVTGGIANLADVPALTVVTKDPVSWLSVVAAFLAAPSEDTYAIDSVEKLKAWKGSIVEKAALEIQVQDAVKTIGISG